MKSPNRIAMFSFHTCPLASKEGKETGGMNIYVLELSKALSQKGLSIDVFTRSQDTTSQKIVNINDNLRVIHLKAGPERPIPKKQLINYLNEFTDEYLAFVRKENTEYDLFHCHYYLSGLIGLLLNRKLKKKTPIVLTFHTLALLKNLVARSTEERENIRRIKAEFLLVKKSNSIIAVSEMDRDYLEFLYDCSASKINVINPGVNTDLFKPMDKKKAGQIIGADPDKKLVLFAGRIEPLKGIDDIIYSAEIITKINPSLKIAFTIVGGGKSRKNLNNSRELHRLILLSKFLGVGNIVKFVGQQAQESLVNYYNAAEALVMPSYYESFGMTALEAMACGTPVITTESTGISSMINSRFKDFMIPANNPLMLARQINQLLSDTKIYDQYKNKMLDKAKSLDWINVADRVMSIYGLYLR